MYELGYCCPYNSNVFWDGRDTELNNHWFITVKFTYEELNEEYEFENQYENEDQDEYQDEHQDEYQDEHQDENLPPHQHEINISTLLQSSENLLNIILHPQIIQSYEIDNTSLCIIKTIWLKIFQRKYRNYYNKKMSYYKNPRNLLNREIFGCF